MRLFSSVESVNQTLALQIFGIIWVLAEMGLLNPGSLGRNKDQFKPALALPFFGEKKRTEIPSQIQPPIKKSPPIGVIGPKIEAAA